MKFWIKTIVALLVTFGLATAITVGGYNIAYGNQLWAYILTVNGSVLVFFWIVGLWIWTVLEYGDKK